MREISVRTLMCCVALGFAGCNANVPATPGTSASQATPQFLPTLSGGAVPASGSGIQYGGGPVLLEPKAYLILWGYKKYGDPDNVAKLLETYFAVMGGSRHNAIYTQYYEVVNGKKKYIQDPRDQYGGVWDDEQDAIPQHPTDAQVAEEALRGIAKLGYDPNGSYVVATAHRHSTDGFGSQWCAAHGNTYDGSKPVSYTNLPYMPDAGGNCGANFITPPKDESATDEGVTIVEGHEYGESVIDPFGNGWSGISSACAWENIANDRFRDKSYTTQPMYSDASKSCVQYYQRRR